MRRLFALLAAATLISVPAAGASTGRRLPIAVDLYSRVPSYGTYGNADFPAVGDCTLAAVADLLQTWSHSGPLRSEPFIAVYYRLDGGSQTAGLTIGRVLNFWQHRGIDGYRIRSWRDLGSISSRVGIERAVTRYGALFVDIIIPSSLPLTGEWSLANSPPSTSAVAFHAAALVGYNRTGPVLVTWGRVQQVTWGWWRTWGVDVAAVERSSQGWTPHTVVPTSVSVSIIFYPPTQSGSTSAGIIVTVSGIVGSTTGTVTVYDNDQPISSCDPLSLTNSTNGLVGRCDVTYPDNVPSQHLIRASYTGDNRYASSGTFGASSINID